MACTPAAFAAVRRARQRLQRARYEAPTRHFVTPGHARHLLLIAIAEARQSQRNA